MLERSSSLLGAYAPHVNTEVFAAPGYARLQLARLCLILSLEAQAVTVAWQVYDRSGTAFSLGMVGMLQFLPMALLYLPAGRLADSGNRRAIMMACQALLAMVALAFFTFTTRGASLVAFYAMLVALGCIRAVIGPAGAAIIGDLVPRELLPSAVAWGSVVWQIAAIAGGPLGGLLMDLRGAHAVYVACAGLCFAALALMVGVPWKGRLTEPSRDKAMRAGFFSGLAYVVGHDQLFGALLLDLLAVVLAGATALLPIFARDILHAGPSALGLLRGAPAAGAAATGLVLATAPIRRRAGPFLFGSVTVFGAMTVVFALSGNLALSLAALVIAGAADMVSVVIRATLVQLAPPPDMRGRVSAINLLFIGASNELGEAESGITAAWIGAVGTTVAGGALTVAAAVVLWFVFPRLAQLDRLDQLGTTNAP
jgi:MFS family permease